MADEPIHIVLVLVDSEANPQDVTTHVGDDIARLELRIPALRVVAPEGEKASVWSAVEWVQQLGIAERGCADGLELVALQLFDMG